MSQDSKQQLADILTSSDYSDRHEIQVPKPKDPPDIDMETSWIKKLLDLLFDHKIPDVTLDLIVIGLKGLAVLTLVLITVWIIKNSDSFIGWIEKQSWRKNKKYQVKIDDYQQAHLAQGWEGLPPHQQISQVVKQLILEGNYLPAMSILYRGSLRWLNDTNCLLISPAETELQCIEHIHKVQQNQFLNKHSGQYICQIIQAWIPIAYQGQTTANQQNLLQITDAWQAKLPLSALEGR
ncbi:MAG: hypothetical protein KGV51_08790 [Moraxellaceae bacterium]|nr:hypothetical protein [Moraxellaceae bacterium]